MCVWIFLFQLGPVDLDPQYYSEYMILDVGFNKKIWSLRKRMGSLVEPHGIVLYRE